MDLYSARYFTNEYFEHTSVRGGVRQIQQSVEPPASEIRSSIGHPTEPGSLPLESRATESCVAVFRY